jgi:hypothetical protein
MVPLPAGALPLPQLLDAEESTGAQDGHGRDHDGESNRCHHSNGWTAQIATQTTAMRPALDEKALARRRLTEPSPNQRE